MKNFKEFQVGKVYGMKSPCDQDCVWYYKVVGRSKCTVTLVQMDRTTKKPRGIKMHYRINSQLSGFYGAEACRPLGSYSMCPTLTAENIVSKL